MITTRLHLDYEGLSELDVTDVGTNLYAAHPSTKVTMASFKINDEKTQQWVPAEGERMPTDLKEGLRDPSVTKIAFNASFERIMTRDVLGIETPIESWRCSMALAYMYSFMGGLGDVGSQMDLTFQKDTRGKQLIKIFCGPNKPTKNQPFVWRDQHSDPEAWEEFKLYNIRDTDTEHEVWKKLVPYFMPEWQWDLYHLDQLINDRGLPINRTFVQNALDIADRRKRELISEQNRITGLDNANSGPQLLPWLQARGYPYDNLQKANVEKTLVAEEEQIRNPSKVYDFEIGKMVLPTYPNAWFDGAGNVHGEGVLTDECRTVMRMRQGSSKTSTTKYEAAMRSISDDDRLRHCFQYAGGSRTNRWAGRKIQPQNLPRTPKWLEDIDDGWFKKNGLDPDDFIDFDRLEFCNWLIEQGDYETLGLYAGEQMDAVSGCVRSAIQAPEGKELVVCDLSSIESVVIGWLTGCERLLNVFREGRCAYRDFATTLYGVLYEEVTKSMRSGAKPAVLGAGYRLSGGELRDGEKTGLWAYAENMGVKLTQEEAQKAVRVFRDTYKEIPQGWYAIEDAIVQAMRTGRVVKWGLLEFEVKKPFLRVKLPSDRYMYYYKLKVEPIQMEGRYGPWTKYSISYMGKDQITQQWKRIESHGGKFIENFVQAIARDILGFGMLEAHAAGLYLVGHVHDEIISEENEHEAPAKFAILKECMTTRLLKKYPWMNGLPLGAAGYHAKVYKKD